MLIVLCMVREKREQFMKIRHFIGVSPSSTDSSAVLDSGVRTTAEAHARFWRRRRPNRWWRLLRHPSLAEFGHVLTCSEILLLVRSSHAWCMPRNASPIVCRSYATCLSSVAACTVSTDRARRQFGACLQDTVYPSQYAELCFCVVVRLPLSCDCEPLDDL